MIEMLGVLAIIGVLSAGGIMGYTAAMTQYKTNKTIDDISHMIVAFRSLIIAKPASTRTIFTAVQLQTIGVIPSSYKINNSAGCTANDVWGTNCRTSSPVGAPTTIYAYDGYDGKRSAITINFYGKVPTSFCVKYFTNDFVSQLGVVQRDIAIYDKNSTLLINTDSIPTLEVAQNVCKDNNYIGSTFSIRK